MTNYPYSSGFPACLLNRELQVLKELELVFILAKAYNFLNFRTKAPWILSYSIELRCFAYKAFLKSLRNISIRRILNKIGRRSKGSWSCNFALVLCHISFSSMILNLSTQIEWLSCSNFSLCGRNPHVVWTFKWYLQYLSELSHYAEKEISAI